jgi:hypothetical protein
MKSHITIKHKKTISFSTLLHNMEFDFYMMKNSPMSQAFAKSLQIVPLQHLALD